jgi:hypothetical protein
MAIMKKKNKSEEDIIKQIEKEFDEAFEYSLGENGKIWGFVNEYDSKFENIPSYLPLLHAAVIEMREGSNISVLDSIKIFTDVLETYTEEE